MVFVNIYTSYVGNSVICKCIPRYVPCKSRTARGNTSETCICTATFSWIGACCNHDRSTLNRIHRFLDETKERVSDKYSCDRQEWTNAISSTNRRSNIQNGGGRSEKIRAQKSLFFFFFEQESYNKNSSISFLLTFARTIAVSALCAKTTLRQIRLAVVGGRLQVDQLASLRDPLQTFARTTADLRLFQDQMRLPRLAGLLRGLVPRLGEIVRLALSFGVVAQYRYHFRRRGMRHRVQCLWRTKVIKFL